MKEKENRNNISEKRSERSQVAILKYLRGKLTICCNFGENTEMKAEQIFLKERKLLILHRTNQKPQLL